MAYARNETEARLRSPGQWGWYGNTTEHARYVQLMQGRFRNRSVRRWAHESHQPRHAS